MKFSDLFFLFDKFSITDTTSCTFHARSKSYLHQHTYILLVTIGGPYQTFLLIMVLWWSLSCDFTMQVQCLTLRVVCYGQNSCNPFCHNCYTPNIGVSHQYQVLWLLCFGRLVSKSDNVIYTNAHTFCWLHILMIIHCKNSFLIFGIHSSTWGSPAWLISIVSFW